MTDKLLPLDTLERAAQGSALYAWSYGRTTLEEFAQVIYLCPTNVCNHRCETCASPVSIRKGRDSSGKNRRGFMGFELFKRIVDQLPRGVRRLYLQKTGEPLLHPKLGEMLAYLKQERPEYELALHSNASELTEDKIGPILDYADFFSLSIFGFDRETYALAHGRDHFERFLDNTKQFHEAWLKSERRPKVYFDVVRTPHTEKLGDAYIHQWLSERFPAFNSGIHFPFNFQGFVPGYDNQVFSRLKPSELPSCIFPWVMAVIHWDGNVGYCVGDATETAFMGHVDEQPLTQIWNNEHYQRFRRGHATKDFADLVACGIHCGNCNWLFSLKSQSALNLCLSGVREYPNPLELVHHGMLVSSEQHLKAGLYHYLRGELAEANKGFLLSELTARGEVLKEKARNWAGAVRQAWAQRGNLELWENALAVDGLSLSTVHVSTYALAKVQLSQVEDKHQVDVSGLALKKSEF